MSQRPEFQEDDQPIIITLPEDKDWQSLLQTKQEQYRKRLETAKYKYQPPEIRNRTENGIKIRLINELFAKGEVNSWDFSRMLNEEFGILFNLGNFERACAVIHAYTLSRDTLEESVNNPGKGLKFPLH